MTQFLRPAPPDLVTLLNTSIANADAIHSVDLYTITLVGGTALRYTDADRAITIGATTWVLGPGLQRGSVVQRTGVDVDNLEVTLLSDTGQLINGLSWPAFAASGGLDGAKLKLQRAFASTPADPYKGPLDWWGEGIITQVEAGRGAVKITAADPRALLNVAIPRRLYRPQCNNTLYDTGCGVNKASFTVSGTATSGTDAQRLTFGATLANYSRYPLGVVTFTSGANAGISRTVRTTTGTTVTLMAPLPAAVAAGDTFTISAGCARNQATCSGTFNNLLRFAGTPYVPAAETVL